MHKHVVANIIARLLLFISAVMFIPLFIALADNPFSSESIAFEITISVGALISLLIMKFLPIKKEDHIRFSAKDGLAIVGFCWILVCVYGAMPLVLSGLTNFTDALFEVVSGFTTTGASIFSDVETLPPGILFWRHLTQWIGGMGIIVSFVTLLPMMGTTAYQLYKTESSALVSDRIEPRVKEAAFKFLGIYVFLSFVQVVLMLLGGMSLYDAFCHMFATIATGGFSTKNISVGAYSPYIQWIVTIFMFLGGMNFMLHYQVARGEIKALWKSEEFKFYSSLLLIAICAYSVVLFVKGISHSPVRDAAFTVISMGTSTGFANADFDLWPNVLRFTLFIFVIIGGCVGSTSGGLKVVRVLLTLRIIGRSVVQAIYPNSVMAVRINGNALSERVIFATLCYFIIYVLLLVLGTVAFMIVQSTDIVTAFTGCAATLGNAGPGLGAVGPMTNFGWINPPGKWILTFLMLAGRLEAYSLFVLFIPSTWRK